MSFFPQCSDFHMRDLLQRTTICRGEVDRQQSSQLNGASELKYFLRRCIGSATNRFLAVASKRRRQAKQKKSLIVSCPCDTDTHIPKRCTCFLTDQFLAVESNVLRQAKQQKHANMVSSPIVSCLGYRPNGVADLRNLSVVHIRPRPKS